MLSREGGEEGREEGRQGGGGRLEEGMLMRGATTLGNTHSCTSSSYRVHCANPPPYCSSGRGRAVVAVTLPHAHVCILCLNPCLNPCIYRAYKTINKSPYHTLYLHSTHTPHQHSLATLYTHTLYPHSIPTLYLHSLPTLYPHSTTLYHTSYPVLLEFLDT